MLKHAKLSPSAAVRWMNCPGSVALTADMPDTTSSYAMEGTIAHKLGEQCLIDGNDTVDHNSDGNYDTDMLINVQNYVDYVRLVKGEKGQLYIEKRLSLEKWIKGGFGTCDAIVLNQHERELHIIDLKYGMNKVDVENNSQLYMYALGAADKVIDHIDKVIVHIVQPRVNYYGSETITLPDLYAFALKVATAAELCLTDNAPLNPSEKACQWCKAKATCPALYKHSLRVVGDDFDPIPIERMTPEQLRMVLDNKTLITKWLKSVEDYATEQLSNGNKFSGYKLVAGRSIRKYNSDAEAVLVKMLGDNAYQQKLISVTDAEKIIGKKQFSELNITFKPSGKTTLVADSDKRPALAPVEKDFDIL